MDGSSIRVAEGPNSRKNTTTNMEEIVCFSVFYLCNLFLKNKDILTLFLTELSFLVLF